MAYLVEIISVGNELLIGKISNTNAQWLAKRITSLGGKVQRVTVIGDDVNEIASTIKESLNHKPNLIITTGGLGPTFDDKTLEGISKALQKPLKLNQSALGMIRETYRKAHKLGILKESGLTHARLKMARLPQGSKPLANPVGTAPGVLMPHQRTAIISLPGVPVEMRAIFENAVAPIIRRAVGKTHFHELSLNITGIVESELVSLLGQVMRDNPNVYIKSHPKIAETASRIELHLSTTSSTPTTAKNIVRKAADEISQLIIKQGGKVLSGGG